MNRDLIRLETALQALEKAEKLIRKVDGVSPETLDTLRKVLALVEDEAMYLEMETEAENIA